MTRNGVTYQTLNRTTPGTTSFDGTPYGGFNGQSYTGTPLLVNSRYRDGIPDINGVDVGIPVDADPYKINFAGKTFRRTREQQYSGQINFDAGPVKLRSISSYTDFTNIATGNSLTPVLLNFSYVKTQAKTYTQELQLLSNSKDSPFQYILGGYYYNDTVTEQNVTNVNRSYVTANAPAGQQYYTFGFTTLPSAAQGLKQTFGFDSLNAYQQKIESIAGYGQLSYTLFDKLTATGGIRWTSDRKTQLASRFNTGTGVTNGYYAHSIDDPINYQCNALIAANAASSATPAAIASAYSFVCNSLKQTFLTYRGAVDYKFDRNHMVYASYSTGAHSGGFNTGVVSLNGVNTLLAFNPEFVTAYEVGSKNTLMNGAMTFNVAAFINNYRNLQAQTSIPNPANPAAVLALVQNIGKDRAYGVDVETIIRPDRHLTVNIAFNYLHARELDYGVNTFNYGGAAAFCNIVTNCVPASGEANTVQGTPFPNSRTDPNRFVPVLGADGKPVVSTTGVPQLLDVIAGKGLDGTVYTSKKAFQPDYTFQLGAAYTIELGSAGTLTPEVQSYFSSSYILTDLTPNFGNQPSFTRTDFRLTYRTANDKFRLQAFINNVESSAVITRAVYASNRTLQASYAIPRTFGVSAGVKF